MQGPAPAVFPLFRSPLTVGLLTQTYIGGGESSIAELAAALGTYPGNVTREVARLEQAAVLRSRSVGRTKLVSANTEAPFYRPLLELVTITLGPGQVLAEELAAVADIEYAAVFGSWAARMAGEQGPAPADIDLLVVGRPDRDDVHDATQRAQTRLGRPVNSVIVSPARWESAADGFLADLRTRPRITVIEPPGDAPGRPGHKGGGA